MKHDTFPSATMHAEDEIDIDALAEEAAQDATGIQMAQDEAEALADTEVRKVLEGTSEHLIEDVIEEISFQAKKEAKKTYIKQNAEKLK